MEVTSRKTGRDLEMFFIEVPVRYVTETTKILNRYSGDSDESYKILNAEFGCDVRFQIFTTQDHKVRILTKLLKGNFLEKFENYC